MYLRAVTTTTKRKRVITNIDLSRDMNEFSGKLTPTEFLAFSFENSFKAISKGEHVQFKQKLKETVSAYDPDTIKWAQDTLNESTKHFRDSLPANVKKHIDPIYETMFDENLRETRQLLAASIGITMSSSVPISTFTVAPTIDNFESVDDPVASLKTPSNRDSLKKRKATDASVLIEENQDSKLQETVSEDKASRINSSQFKADSLRKTLQKPRTIPRYMQHTESSKAKIRQKFSKPR